MFIFIFAYTFIFSLYWGGASAPLAPPPPWLRQCIYVCVCVFICIKYWQRTTSLISLDESTTLLLSAYYYCEDFATCNFFIKYCNYSCIEEGNWIQQNDFDTRTRLNLINWTISRKLMKPNLFITRNLWGCPLLDENKHTHI